MRAFVKLPVAPGAAAVLEMLPPKAAPCQVMLVANHGLRRPAKPPSLARPAAAEFAILPAGLAERRIEPARGEEVPVETDEAMICTGTVEA